MSSQSGSPVFRGLLVVKKDGVVMILLNAAQYSGSVNDFEI